MEIQTMCEFLSHLSDKESNKITINNDSQAITALEELASLNLIEGIEIVKHSPLDFPSCQIVGKIKVTEAGKQFLKNNDEFRM